MQTGTLKLIFNRNFTVATLTNFLVMLSYYQTFVTTTLYASQVYGASLSVAGSTLGAIIIGCLFGRFLSGNLISTLGSRMILVGGVLCFTICTALPLVINSLPLLFVQRFATGFFMGMTGTATGSIMAFCIPYEVQGLGVSIFSLSTALSLALGPFIGLSVQHNLGNEMLLFDQSALCLAALLCTFCLKSGGAVQTVHKSLWKLSNYLDVRVMKFAMVALLMALGYGVIASFLATYAKEEDMTEVASVFFFLQAAVTIVTRPISGRWFDRFGENLIVYPCIFLSSLALVLIGIGTHPAFILAAGVLQGLGFGNFQSSGQALALHLVRKYRFPQATSTFFIFFDLGMGVSPYIFGLVAAFSGMGTMFVIAGLCVFSALFVYYFAHGKNHPLKRPLLKKKLGTE